MKTPLGSEKFEKSAALKTPTVSNTFFNTFTKARENLRLEYYDLLAN